MKTYFIPKIYGRKSHIKNTFLRKTINDMRHDDDAPCLNIDRYYSIIYYARPISVTNDKKRKTNISF